MKQSKFVLRERNGEFTTDNRMIELCSPEVRGELDIPKSCHKLYVTISMEPIIGAIKVIKRGFTFKVNRCNHYILGSTRLDVSLRLQQSVYSNYTFYALIERD